MEKIEADESPKLSAHHDAILRDSALFASVDALYARREQLGRDPESAQVLERYEKLFVRAGAKLSEPDKAKLKAINEELSSLGTKFRQNTLQGTKDGAVVVDDVARLDGLPPEAVSAAAEAAKARGLTGKWGITPQNTTGHPPLQQPTDRSLPHGTVHPSSPPRLTGPADNRDEMR